MVNYSLFHVKLYSIQDVTDICDVVMQSAAV